MPKLKKSQVEVGLFCFNSGSRNFFLEENHATEVKNGDLKDRHFFEYQALARFVTVDSETIVLLLLKVHNIYFYKSPVSHCQKSCGWFSDAPRLKQHQFWILFFPHFFFSKKKCELLSCCLKKTKSGAKSEKAEGIHWDIP